MKHALPPLDSLKVFESAARHLSFTRAAKELCMTKGAVSYQIQRLEQELDCQLFKRSVRQVYLTDTGQQLIQVTRQVFFDLSSALKRIKPVSSYDVSIAATTYVAARWLSPRVAKFLKQHPDTSIQFEHGINTDEFVLEDVDIAIQWGRCDSQKKKNDLLLLPMPLFPACSPAQAKRMENDPKTLGQVTLLYENRDQDLWQEWFHCDNVINPTQTIEDANVRVQAAIDGQGLILADAMMQTELDTGTLVAPFNKQLKGYGYTVRSSTIRHKNSEANAMIEWLTAEKPVAK